MGGKFHGDCLTANDDLHQAYDAFLSTKPCTQKVSESRATTPQTALQGNFTVDLEKCETETATFSNLKELTQIPARRECLRFLGFDFTFSKRFKV
jgi:hypothetical protein